MLRFNVIHSLNDRSNMECVYCYLWTNPFQILVLRIFWHRNFEIFLQISKFVQDGGWILLIFTISNSKIGYLSGIRLAFSKFENSKRQIQVQNNKIKIADEYPIYDPIQYNFGDWMFLRLLIAKIFAAIGNQIDDFFFKIDIFVNKRFFLTYFLKNTFIFDL